MQRIVGKPIYIRFYDEFPFFSFRCSVRVCYLALWMLWVVLLYNSLRSIAVQQAQEVIRKCVYLDSIFLIFFLYSWFHSLFLSPPTPSSRRNARSCLASTSYSYYYYFSFFFSFPFPLLISSVENSLFRKYNIIPLKTLTKWVLALLLRNEFIRSFLRSSPRPPLRTYDLTLDLGMSRWVPHHLRR